MLFMSRRPLSFCRQICHSHPWSKESKTALIVSPINFFAFSLQLFYNLQNYTKFDLSTKKFWNRFKYIAETRYNLNEYKWQFEYFTPMYVTKEFREKWKVKNKKNAHKVNLWSMTSDKHNKVQIIIPQFVHIFGLVFIHLLGK